MLGEPAPFAPGSPIALMVPAMPPSAPPIPPDGESIGEEGEADGTDGEDIGDAGPPCCES